MKGLLDDGARRLYREIVARGGRVPYREALAQDPDATRRLIDLGLLVHPFDTDESLTAVSPRAVGARLSSELRTEAGRRLAEAERAPARLEPLVQAFDARGRRADRTTVVRHIDGMEEIRHRLQQIESEAREEMLALQPGGARPRQFLQESLERTREHLAAGIVTRTVYQPGALADPPTTAYAADVTALGERIRVLDEPFTRLLLFDRRVAVVPAAADNTSAAFVEDPVLVALLVERFERFERFERDWARAAIVDWHARAGRPPETGVPAELTGLLAAGLTQKAIASRLGLSERTVAGHLARLREHHDAETLFQLGWLMREGAR